NLARTERDLDNLADARTHIRDATDKVESLRADVANQELRASFVATIHDVYDLAVDVLMRSHKQEPSKGLDAMALNTSELGRARSLIELLAESRADIRQGVDTNLLERERALEQLLTEKAKHYSQLLAGKHSEEQAAAAAKESESITTDYHQVLAQIRAT